MLEKEKQPAVFGEEAYDSFVDSDLWDLPSTELQILEGGIMSHIAVSIVELCSDLVDLKNFDVESTLNRMWGAAAEPADSYYQIRLACTDVPKTRFKIKPDKDSKTNSKRGMLVQEGSLDIGKTLKRIRRRGIHPSIRGEVWEFLLGCYDPMSTFEEREQTRQSRRLQYASWKEECKQMFLLIGSGRFITAPVITDNGQPNYDPLVLQEINFGTNSNGSDFLKELTSRGPLYKKVIQWLLTLHQIGLDVNRTDKTLVFYEKKDNLSKLWDILSVYAWIDKDVGYCQGCIKRVFSFFELKSEEISTAQGDQLELKLSLLIWLQSLKLVDPKLHQHLDKLGGGDYLFPIRMLMVQFRREISFCDSLYLWEMMWALEYDHDLFYVYEAHQCGSEKTQGFKDKPKSINQCGKYERQNMRNGGKTAEGPLPIYVFLVASVLKDKSTKLMTEARGVDDVVKVQHTPFFNFGEIIPHPI